MKKSTLLFLLIFISLFDSYAQSLSDLETEVQKFVLENLNTPLPAKILNEIANSDEFYGHPELKESALESYKAVYWRGVFFKNNPKKLTKYRSLVNGRLLNDPCFNPGFENGFDGYAGESGLFQNNGTSCMMNDYDFAPNTANFPGITDFSIVGVGDDPNVTVISLEQVLAGTRAARINDTEVGWNVDKLVKTVTLPFIASGDHYRFYYWYALVMQNPDGHEDLQPFFQVRYCDSNGNCFDANCKEANAANTQDFGVQPNNGTVIVYRNWDCAYIDFPSSLSEQEVTVEFIASDCGLGAHWGYAYVDEICTPCGAYDNGKIALDPLIDACENEFPIIVTGSYDPPASGGTLQSLTLRITQNGEIINTLVNPVINSGAGSFSFTINPADILGESGCFDVYANVVFDLGGGATAEAFSLSANPNTTSSYDNDFCSSHAECVCEGGSVSFYGIEGSVCLPLGASNVYFGGQYTLPLLQPGGTPATISNIVVTIYSADNTPPTANDILFQGNATVNTSFLSYSLPVPTTTLGPGCYHAHVQATFICDGEELVRDLWQYNIYCWNTEDCKDPTITLNPIEGECFNYPLQVCGSYTLPVVGGITGLVQSITLTVRNQNNQFIFSLTDAQIDPVNQTFCFELDENDFPIASPYGCFNLSVSGSFQALEQQAFANYSISGSPDICIEEDDCCKVTIGGGGYCGNSCQMYLTFAQISVNVIGQDCGPGYVQYTALSDGQFYNPNNGTYYTTFTKNLIYYGVIGAGPDEWWSGSIFKPFIEFPGSTNNCILVEVFKQNGQLLGSKTVCFDLDCPRPGGKLLATQCNLEADPRPAPNRLMITGSQLQTQAMVYYDDDEFSKDQCIIGHVQPTQGENCCIPATTPVFDGEGYCFEVTSNPFSVNLDALNTDCVTVRLYASDFEDGLSIVAEGCYTQNQLTLQNPPSADRVSILGVPEHELIVKLDLAESIYPIDYQILNVTGQVFLSGKLDIDHFQKIDISQLHSGIYLINFSQKESAFAQTLFFVKK